MISTAELSVDGLFRTSLLRRWTLALPVLVVVMVNPSTADAKKNDPTISRLIHFAMAWGYGGIFVVNLFTFRSSTQPALQKAIDPWGPDCLRAWDEAIGVALHWERPILVAWGNGGALFGADKRFLQRARDRHVKFVCLGTTQSGQPKHPLARGQHRIDRGQRPIEFAA